MNIEDISIHDLTSEQINQWESLQNISNGSKIYSSYYWNKNIYNTEKINYRLLFIHKNNNILFGFFYYLNKDNKQKFYNLNEIFNGYDPLITGHRVCGNMNRYVEYLIIGSRGSTSCDVRFKSDLSKKDWEHYIDILVRFLKKKYPTFYITFMYVNDQNLRTLLTKSLPGNDVKIGYTHIFDNNYTSLEEYISEYKSKMRNEIINTSNSFIKSGYKVEEIIKNKEKIHSYFLLQNSLKYGEKYFDTNFFTIYMKSLGENYNVKVFGILDNNNILIGTILYIVLEDTVYVDSIGFAYSKLNRNSKSYFYLMFLKTIDFCIKNKIKFINYGEGLHKTKLKWGTDLTLTSIFFYDDFLDVDDSNILDSYLYLRNYSKKFYL